MSAEELSDAEFMAAISVAKFPGGKFGHHGHVRMAWICLKGTRFEAGMERIRSTVKGFAAILGVPEKYNETVTRAWAECVQAALEKTPDIDSFDAFLAAHPELLSAGLLERYYRKETLESPEAKGGWVLPDLQPLPSRREGG
ncbi:MAG TPA: hypothetical protein VK539_12270 [Myxococcaceae bacterium]|nr:hypothetical protein [Myxococcaceae bacterium]